MVKESRNHFLPDNVIFLVLEKKGIVMFLIVNLWFHKEFLLFAPLYNTSIFRFCHICAGSSSVSNKCIVCFNRLSMSYTVNLNAFYRTCKAAQDSKLCPTM